MSVQVYAPKAVKVLIAGLYSISGFADNSSVRVSKNQEPVSLSVGAQGSTERTQTANRSYRITLSLQSSSPSNDILTALYSIDDASGRLTFPIYVVDDSGTSKFTALECWVAGIPDISFSNSTQSREWILECSKGVYGLGGNATDSDILTQAANLSTLISQVGGSLNVF